MELHSSTVRRRWLSLTLCAALSLTACGGDEEEEAAAAAPATSSSTTAPSGSPTASSGSGNRAPTIAGTPPTSTLQGRQYSFTPSATDADGNPLTFSIANRPTWASFNSATGRLQGAPTQAEIGRTFSNIQISVTDGTATSSLATFGIQVVGTASGTAMLSWTPPTQNSDGSALTDLASYRVYFGTQSGSFANSVTVNNPGLASFVIDQLTPATWHFVVTAVNASGVESRLSNAANKTVM
jgi:hypothetical protein